MLFYCYIDCAIIPEKRIQCSIPHAQQALCNALNCCWSHQTDPSVPNCYYSCELLNLLLTKNLMIGVDQCLSIVNFF